MPNIFLISDHHLGHENTFKLFKLADGITPLRPFTSIDEMHKTMVDNHNSVVKPSDKVYFLGDVSFGSKYIHLLDEMNGEKILIKGNHDTLKLSVYMKYFKDVRGSHQFDGVLLTHIPVHPESLARWGVNIHGHLHANRVKGSDGLDDKRYFNVSVEQLNYTPISLEQVKAKVGINATSNI